MDAARSSIGSVVRVRGRDEMGSKRVKRRYSRAEGKEVWGRIMLASDGLDEYQAVMQLAVTEPFC